jgi:hypothetical protein
MKIDTLVIIAAAGAGLYFMSRTLKNSVPTAYTPPRQGGTASSLNNGGNLPTMQVSNTALPGDPGWGWTYYNDGTAIGPNGDYYFQGQKVWSA